MQARSCFSDRGDSLEWVATAYGIRDFSVSRSHLEAHGIMVVAEQWYVIANLPHYTSAIGGIPIRVPARQARRAVALLRSVEAEPDAADRRPSINSRIWIAVLFIAVLGFAVAPPSSGIVVNCRSLTERVAQIDT